MIDKKRTRLYEHLYEHRRVQVIIYDSVKVICSIRTSMTA